MSNPNPIDGNEVKDSVQINVNAADDTAALDDQAAELDENAAAPNDGAPTDSDPAVSDGSGTVTGLCRGGPYDGRTVTSRKQGGFLLADKENGVGFLYDWNGQSFVCRDPGGAPLDEETRQRISDEGTHDILARDDAPAA